VIGLYELLGNPTT